MLAAAPFSSRPLLHAALLSHFLEMATGLAQAELSPKVLLIKLMSVSFPVSCPLHFMLDLFDPLFYVLGNTVGLILPQY